MEYLVEIKEVLSKQVKIEAASAENALFRVRKSYLDSDIVLGADDFVDYEINIKNGP